MATKDRTALKDEFKNGNLATGERFADLIDSMKAVQEPVVDPQALGTSLSFIDSISQDADGKITPTKKTLDLANAHELNPFKGWYKTGDTLPTDGFDGAYLYFKDTSELTGQTTIYRWNGTAYADTGTVVDTSNVQTFETGQAVNAVAIDGTELKNPAGNALPKAEEVMQLAAKLAGVTAEEVKASYTVYHPANYNDGYYKEQNGDVTWQNSPDSFKTGVIDIAGYKYARFLGFVKVGSEPAVVVFVQKNDNGDVLYWEHYKNDPNATGIMEYKTKIVDGATKLYLCVRNGNSELYSKFYCYLGNGEPASVPKLEKVVKKIDLSLYRFVYHGNKSNNQWGNTTNDKTTAIPVKEGDIVRFSVGSVGTSSTAYSGYAFMKDHTLNKYQPLGFADGFGVIPVAANTNYEVKVPKECTNIVFFEQYSSTVLMQLSSVEVETEKEPQEEVRLVAVPFFKKESAIYRMDGTYNPSDTSNSCFYVVEEGSDYCINTRVGYQGTVAPASPLAIVTYLGSDMETVLGHDEQLTAKGYNYFPHHHRLTIPSGTKYVVLFQPPTMSAFGLFQILDSETVLDAVNYIETEVCEPNYGQMASQSAHVFIKRLSAWGFRLPKSYDEDAVPCPVVAMLHGYSGMVTENVLGYANSAGTETAAYWKGWQDAYLDAGFAVMDINGYGLYSEDPDTASHGGCPMAIETLKKAFEYMKAHYNVMPKMFIQGSSMGTGLAQNYIRLYAEDVISVALMAPVNAGSSILMAQSQDSRDRYIKAWGYATYEDCISDELSHLYGYVPLFNCLKIDKSSSLPSINKVDLAMMSDFWAQQPDYTYIEKAAVPIRIWGGTVDTSVPRLYYMALYNMYLNGGSNVSLREIVGADHNFCTSYQNSFVRQEAIEYFRRSLWILGQ